MRRVLPMVLLLLLALTAVGHAGIFGNKGYPRNSSFESVNMGTTKLEPNPPPPQYLTVSVVGDSMSVLEPVGWDTVPTADVVLTASSNGGGTIQDASWLSNGRIIVLSNYSVGGWTTQDVLTTNVPGYSKTQLQLALADNPQVIYVSLGANDVTHQLTVQQVKSNIDTIINTVLAAGKICVWGDVPPDGAVTWAATPSEANMMLEINDYLRSWANRSRRVIIIDRYNSTLDPTQSDMAQKANYFKDGVHPTVEGGMAIASDFLGHWGSLFNPMSMFSTGLVGDYPQQLLWDHGATFTPLNYYGGTSQAAWTQVNGSKAVTADSNIYSSDAGPSYDLNQTGAGIYRPLPFSLRDYEVEFTSWLHSSASQLVFFGCTSSGNGYAFRINQTGTIDLVTVTGWITVGTVLTSVSAASIPTSGAPECYDNFVYTLQVYDNEFVTLGQETTSGSSDTRLTQPILNYDLGSTALNDTNLYYGFGSSSGISYVNSIRVYMKRRSGTVSPWNPAFTGPWETSYETTTAPPPATGWSGTLPWLGDANGLYVGDSGKSVWTWDWTRIPLNVSGGTVAMSKAANADGSNTWRWTITASAAGNAQFRFYFPVSALEVGRYYVWAADLTFTPPSGQGLAFEFSNSAVSRAGHAIVMETGAYDSAYPANDMYTARTLNFLSDPVYIGQYDNMGEASFTVYWTGAGTYTVDISKLGLRDVTDLYHSVTGK